MSYTNILEGTRQYFQGLPSASPGSTNNNAVGSAPSPAAAASAPPPPAPQQPQAYFPPQPGGVQPQPPAGWTGKPYPFNNTAPPNSTTANPVYESPKPSYTFNNYNHAAPAANSKPTVNNVQYQGKQATYMYNNAGVYEAKQTSNHQEHNSTLLNLDRQPYDRTSSSSRSLAASSTHQQYPTIATMDRAFAQQYSASSKNDAAHSFNSVPNNRHSTPTAVSYSVPPQSQYPSASPQTPQQYANPTQQYPTTAAAARPPKPSAPQLNQQQQQQQQTQQQIQHQQHLYSQHQLRQHIANSQAKQQLKMQQYQQQQQQLSAGTAAKVQQYQQQQAVGTVGKVQQYQPQPTGTTVKVHNFQAPSNSTQLYHPSTNSTSTSKIHPFQQVVSSNNKIHPFQAIPTSTNQYPQVAPSNSINSTSGKTSSSHYQPSSSSKMHQFQTSNSAAASYQQSQSIPSSSSSKGVHHFQPLNSSGSNYQSIPSSSSKVHQLQAAPSSNNTAGNYQQSLPSSSTSKVHQFQASATNSTAGNYQAVPSSSSKYQGSAKFPSPSLVQAGKARQLQQASSAGTYQPNFQGYPTMATPNPWFAAAMQSQQQLRQPTKGEASKSGDVSKQHMAAMQQASHMLQPPKAPPAVRHRSGPRRDSPLDLSVRTIRRSADSTLDDDTPIEVPRTLPDTTHTTPSRTQVDLSLPSLLRSSDNVLLPSFRPSFRQGSHGETEKPRDSSLLSLEHKFGPHVTAPAETVSQLPQYQQMPTGHMQYHSHRQHAMPHLAAHAMSQYQRHPKPNNAAADKRVLSILRNSLEVRNQQQHKLMAGMDSGSYRLQVPRAMDSASPQFLREARQQAEAMHPPSFSAEAMQPPQYSAEAVPPFSCPPQQAEHLPPFSDGPPQQQDAELDGLAAYLAARIRTKAELKQCDDGPRQTLQASCSSPPRCPCVGPCACPEGRVRKTCPCVGPCTCPAVERPSRKICACLGPCSCPEGPPRTLSRKISDTRSSTETSVFDFPDSDTEMAAPASVKDLRRSRKAPSIDTPLELTPTAPAPPAATPAVEEDPMWASVCSSFVTCLETRGAKTSRAGQHNLALARKRRLAQEREEPSKVAKTEPAEEPKTEVSKEELELIESCIKATSECEKLLETIPPPVPSKVDTSSDSDESLSLAQRLMELPSTTDSSSSSEDSDWSDDVGRAVVTRLQPRSTRSRGGGRAYNITTRLRSNQAPPAKRPGRPRRKAKSPEESSREESPRPMRKTRQSPDVRKTRRKSPSPELRRSRRKSKSPVNKTRNKSKSPVSKRNKSKSPVSKTRNKSKSPTPNKRSKSKSPVRQKSKSPVRQTVKKSKSPEPTKRSKSPEPTKRSKSPVTRNERQSRKESPDCGFYPGWESELVRFKQSVRMPSNLISVHSRPSSDPPTPTKTRRGATNSPMSDPGLRGVAAKKLLREMDNSDSSASSPAKQRKHLIRDVECSDSSNHSGRPPKDRKELLAKLASKLRGRGRRKKEEGEIKVESEDEEDKRPRVPLRRGLRKRRRSSRLSGPGERRMLRSAALQRSNRALLNSKRHLRRRDLREGGAKPVTGAKRGPKGRRKLRSSGFDYLRKKKKKKEINDTTPRKVIGVPAIRQMASSIEEIASEVRGWVVNKGLGETVLHRAARLCHNDVAAYCLETLGMPPSPRDNAGYTPLHEACARGHLSTARLLLLYGAKVDSSAQGGIRPLHEAADCGHVELLRLLLSYGADPLLATYCGQTPLALASSPGAHRLLEGHLADVQGRPASPWTLGPRWSQDAEERGDWAGFDVLADAPSCTATCQSEDEMGQFEELPVPTCAAPSTWLLPNDPDVFVLLSDLCSTLGRSPDWVRRSLGTSLLAKELPRSQFLETARCCHLLAADWTAPKLANLVTLVRNDEAVKRLLATRSKGGR